MSIRRLAPKMKGFGAPLWVTLLLCCLAQFMTILDVSVVNVALPSIKRDLGFSGAGLAWVINAYTLLFAGFLLLGGRAGDYFGRRRMYLIGLSLFTTTSLVAGFANSQGLIIAARAVQGFGGALLAPTTLAILATSYTDRQARARALGVWSAIGSMGGLVGTLAGGVITDLLSWRWIFFINVPVGALTVLAAFVLLPHQQAKRASSLDLTGALLSTAGLCLVVYGIVTSARLSWSSPETLLCLFGGIALLGVFALHEGRLAKAPLMPLRMFKIRSLSGANIVQFAVAAATFPLWYVLTLYFQEVLGYSPLKTGLAFLPTSITIALGAQTSSRFVARLGPRRILIIGTAGMAISLYALTGITMHSSYFPRVIIAASAAAFSMGMAFTPLAYSATAQIAREETGLASGMLNTARQVGASIGLALIAVIASTRATSLSVLHHLSAPLALNNGLDLALNFAVATALFALVSCWALPSKQRFSAPAAQTPMQEERVGELIGEP